MDDLASLAVEAIVAARRRAEQARKQRAPAPAPAPAPPPPAPRRAPAGAIPSLAISAPDLRDLEPLAPLGVDFEDPGARPRRPRAPRPALLDVFRSPGGILGGIVMAEVLGLPLSLRPPKTGP